MTEKRNSAGPEAASGHGGQKFHRESAQEKLNKSKLRMDKRGGKLDAARERLANQKPPKRPGPVKRAGRVVTGEAHAFVHGKIYQQEHDNVGVEAGHRMEMTAEAGIRHGTRRVKKAIRQHPAKSAARAESKYIKATADYNSRKLAQEHPEAVKNAAARYWQRHQMKRQYQKQAREAAKQGARAAEKTVLTTEKLAANTIAFIKRHPTGVLLALGCVLILVLMQSCMSSLLSLGNGTIGAVAASTYASEDADMLGAEAAYCALEAELQSTLDNYEHTHSYDEYHYDLADIEHDPYVLISILSAWHEGAWTLDEVHGTIQMLFDRQYVLTESVVKERRYYIETDTWTDEDGNTHTDSYRVYYDYYICTVTLKNENLSHLPIYIMGADQLSRYALYMATLGNRPDLFPSSSYVGKYVTNGPTLHDVPEAYLADETFAAMLTEAEKFIGYPYVWGGYCPSTSFDCSGFVSWVINHSGWDVGRLGAQGLYNICTRTSSPRPGDLVFFTGTYDTPGISHVGIYVGDNFMLHCGDPIQFADLSSSYWQSHLYAYGRLPQP